MRDCMLAEVARRAISGARSRYWLEAWKAIGGEVSFVEGDGFGGQEMQGDGVSGEGVDDEDVELIRGFVGE